MLKRDKRGPWKIIVPILSQPNYPYVLGCNHKRLRYYNWEWYISIYKLYFIYHFFYLRSVPFKYVHNTCKFYCSNCTASLLGLFDILITFRVFQQLLAQNLFWATTLGGYYCTRPTWSFLIPKFLRIFSSNRIFQITNKLEWNLMVMSSKM